MHDVTMPKAQSLNTRKLCEYRGSKVGCKTRKKPIRGLRGPYMGKDCSRIHVTGKQRVDGWGKKRRQGGGEGQKGRMPMTKMYKKKNHHEANSFVC